MPKDDSILDVFSYEQDILNDCALIDESDEHVNLVIERLREQLMEVTL